MSLLPLVLMKGDDGWAIAPGVTTAGNYQDLAEERAAEQDRVIATYHEQKDDLSKKAAARFLERFVAAVPKEGGSVTEEEAGMLVKTFRDCLREGNLLEAFGCCALLDPEDGAWEALKSLSYEHRGVQRASQPDQEVKVTAGKQWAAVSLRLDSGGESEPIYPMYLVVSTEQGPRIVVDVGLRLATNKGREVLNKRVWRRIEEHLDEKETALVRSLFEAHVEASTADLAEWEKNNK